MLCEACERGDHDQCGMQTWCECDCPGADGVYIPDDFYFSDDLDGGRLVKKEENAMRNGDDPAAVMRRVLPHDGFRFLAGRGSNHNHPCMYGHGNDKGGMSLTVVARDGTSNEYQLPGEEHEAFAAFHRALKNNGYL